MIKNIIFDMGGVLIDYDPERVAYDLFDKDTAEIVLKYLLRSELWAERDRGTLTSNEAFEACRKYIPEHALEKTKELAFNLYPYMPQFEKMRDLVITLKNKGYKIYLLSNASDDFYDHSTYIEAFKYFDGFVVSSDYKLLKPEKEIYETLFNKFNLIPEECFFIDDMEKNIKGAAACGMNGHVFSIKKFDDLLSAFKNAGIEI